MENEIIEAYAEITNEEVSSRINDILEILDIDEILNIPGVMDIIEDQLKEKVLEEYEEENSHYLDYDAVLEMFLSQFEDCQASIISYTIDRVKAKINDDIMLREDFNNYTDMLCKEDQISTYAYENWDNPF